MLCARCCALHALSQLRQLDARLSQEVLRDGVIIRVDVNDAHDASIDDHFGAGQARLMRDVNGAAGDGDAVPRRLQEGILFRMNRSRAVTIYHQTTNVHAMRQAARRAVVACRQNAFVFHDDGTDGCAWTSRALRDFGGDPQEVFIPARA